jgi:hypothetical protein
MDEGGKSPIDYNTSISIKLIGGFGTYDKEHIQVKVSERIALSDLLNLLTDKFDLDLKGYGSSYVILVNDIESSIIGGLKLKIEPRDELVLLRISHGG